uniref:Uncharacterized protein n=1 Tax=Panagrolaimus sp. ES5 TaxID=591445 RepID=A0AC34GH35_9BILA
MLFRQEMEELDIVILNLSFTELKVFSKCVKKIWIRSHRVKYDNGEVVPSENINTIFSKNTTFCMNFGGYYKDTICKSCIDFIEACNTVKEVDLRCVPEMFDIPKFYRHLK